MPAATDAQISRRRRHNTRPLDGSSRPTASPSTSPTLTTATLCNSPQPTAEATSDFSFPLKL